MEVRAWLDAHPAPPAQKRPREFEINFSRLRAYLECPWEYKLRFVDWQRQPPSAPGSLGMTVHKALESFHREEAPDLARLLELYDKHFHHAGFADPKEKELWYKKGQAMLKKYWKDEESRRTKAGYMEREFIFPLGPHTVRGMIDRVDEHPDGRFEVIDYKTGAEGEAGESAFFQELQLKIYGLGCKEALGLDPALLTLYYVATGHRKTVDYDDSGEEELKELLTRAAVLMAAGQHLPANTSFCPSCVFRKTCQFSVAPA
ncbi:MAG: PD-(D/E)XK nuclease family protein [Elusimicrobia bacterium]|nr:PD-(D/E)XK nuclease family protein [Elusimicrobiota bacterium]